MMLFVRAFAEETQSGAAGFKTGAGKSKGSMSTFKKPKGEKGSLGGRGTSTRTVGGLTSRGKSTRKVGK